MSHEPPDPFEESRKKLMEEWHAEIGSLKAVVGACRADGVSIEPREDGGGYAINNVRAMRAEQQVERCRETLEALKLMLQMLVVTPSQRPVFEKMVDSIDLALASSVVP